MYLSPAKRAICRQISSALERGRKRGDFVQVSKLGLLNRLWILKQ